MGARVYDPAQRRFLTPDTVVSNPLYGQAFNPWTYAYNNPLRFTDPSGHDGEEQPPEQQPPPNDQGSIPPQDLSPLPPPPSTPGNARTPDVPGPGGDDPRVVGDFSISQEGVNGEYSNWAAWATELNGGVAPASFNESMFYSAAGASAGVGLGARDGHAMGYVAAACPLCGAALVTGLVGYGLYELATGGAERLWESGRRVVSDRGTNDDYWSLYMAAGGLCSGASRPAGTVWGRPTVRAWRSGWHAGAADDDSVADDDGGC